MSTTATSSCRIDSWKEHAYHEAVDGAKLTRAEVKQTLSGDIEGQGDVQWLMCYRPDGTAAFVGLQLVSGRVGERSGTMVLESRGTFDGQTAAGSVRIVAGSGTGELSGIIGEGELQAPRGDQPALTLTYGFE